MSIFDEAAPRQRVWADWTTRLPGFDKPELPSPVSSFAWDREGARMHMILTDPALQDPSRTTREIRDLGRRSNPVLQAHIEFSGMMQSALQSNDPSFAIDIIRREWGPAWSDNGHRAGTAVTRYLWQQARPTWRTFSEAFAVGYDAQVRNWSMFGLEHAFEQADAEQLRYIREKLGEEPALHAGGLVRPPMPGYAASPDTTNWWQQYVPDGIGQVPAGLRSGMRSYRSYLDMARFFENGGTPDGVVQQIEAWDKDIVRLRERIGDPTLMTYRELWGLVKERAGLAEWRWERGVSANWSAAGGGLAGAAAGSMNINTDPVNTLSLSIGSGGTTLARRIATAAGSNALAEAINQVTGVQENRRLLGLEHSASQAMQQIQFAGAVGGTFQGGAEFPRGRLAPASWHP